MEKKAVYFLLSLWYLGISGIAWGTPLAYITNYENNNVSVINTASNTVIGSPIPVG